MMNFRFRNEFNTILEDVAWMDNKTKAAAIEKSKSISTHIAYPPELLEDEKLSEFYKDVIIFDYMFFFLIIIFVVQSLI